MFCAPLLLILTFLVPLIMYNRSTPMQISQFGYFPICTSHVGGERFFRMKNRSALEDKKNNLEKEKYNQLAFILIKEVNNLLYKLVRYINAK